MKNFIERKDIPLFRYYSLQLNLIMGIYNVGVLFLYYQNWVTFIIGMMNLGVWLFFRNKIEKNVS
tara:strand:+ start:419 stop:613 length:195 start_codon:yes stop_codon:yes gene_type:complete